jgi:hypothetical protein
MPDQVTGKRAFEGKSNLNVAAAIRTVAAAKQFTRSFSTFETSDVQVEQRIPREVAQARLRMPPRVAYRRFTNARNQPALRLRQQLEPLRGNLFQPQRPALAP